MAELLVIEPFFSPDTHFVVLTVRETLLVPSEHCHTGITIHCTVDTEGGGWLQKLAIEMGKAKAI